MGIDKHDSDFFAWTHDQAELLKRGDLEHLDVKNLIDELESMGNSQLRALSSHLVRLVTHLLKLKYQSEYINTQSWVRSVKESRYQVAKLLKKQPSLKNKIDAEYEECYETARRWALEETGLQDHVLPIINPFTIKEILDENYFP